MTKKIIYAMRHCETLFNVQNKTQGWCDSPVTERGREQCRIAGEELARRGVKFDRAFSSTSERCCDTLEMVTAAAYGAPMPYERKKDLREVGFGAFEGKDNFLERFPHGDFYLPYGGENNEMVLERFDRFVCELDALEDATNILIVSSGGALITYFMERAQKAEGVKPTSYGNLMTYVYELEDGVMTCIETYAPDFSSLGTENLPKNPDDHGHAKL